MSSVNERKAEILCFAKENNLSKEQISQLTDKSLTESQLHGIVWAFRDKLPVNAIIQMAKLKLNYEEFLFVIRCFKSFEISNDVIFDCLNNNNLDALYKNMDEIKEKRESFQDALLHNELFRTSEVYEIMRKESVLYVKHEFNWASYESRLVLIGGEKRLCFPMPQIPLIGGCWSNQVAQRMLMGQMFLQFCFKAATASLEFIKTVHQFSCKIVPCDNCFYAPYLYFNKNKDDSMDKWGGDSPEKVYMDYLTKEYPEAYNWLMKQSDNQSFYDDFYILHIPNIS